MGLETNKRMARPTIFTEELLQKLEEAFAWGCTDDEACVYADISPSSLYNYQNEKPEFLERKELLKTKPILKARRIVIEAMEKNPTLAFKFLERKRRDEFGEQAHYALVSDRADEREKIEEMRIRMNEMIDSARSQSPN